MNLLVRYLSFLLIGFFGVTRLLDAQLAPPPQDYVVAIGAATLRAPLTADFSPGISFTVEAWIYLPGTTNGGWIAGKCFSAPGVDPFLSFSLQTNINPTSPTGGLKARKSLIHRLSSPKVGPTRADRGVSACGFWEEAA